MCADIVNASSEQWIVWCGLNDESKELAKAIPDSIEVSGSDSNKKKIDAINGFIDGTYRVLVSKAKIFGMGLNLQHCHNMCFVGLSDSWEQYYQAVRRFGQKENVNVHIIYAETEGRVVANIQRKEQQASDMFDGITAHINETWKKGGRKTMQDGFEIEEGERWKVYLGDSVETVKQIEDESVGLSVFSPPFPGMYAYTNSAHDIGNCNEIAQLLEHFEFLVDDIKRILMPGRSCCIHLAQEPIFKWQEGYSGLRDFRGEIIRMMQKHDFIFASERMIDKCPILKGVRTKDAGLAMKTAATDSSKVTGAMTDYLLQFKKKGENPEPIRALSNHPTNPALVNPEGWYTAEEWQWWASSVWWNSKRHTPDGGISESDVLRNFTQGKGIDDEKHLCPLQLGVIERCVKLWSAPDDLVYSPFTGIGSEGYQSVILGRRFVGGELKDTYFKVACDNLQHAEIEWNNRHMDLLSGIEDAVNV